MDEFQEAMVDFSVLKYCVIGRKITDPPIAKKQRKVENEVDDDEDDIDACVPDILPENQQVNAKKIVPILCPHAGDLVSWTADGDVSIHGKPLRRVNFADLFSGMVRSRPLKNIPYPMKSF